MYEIHLYDGNPFEQQDEPVGYISEKEDGTYRVTSRRSLAAVFPDPIEATWVLRNIEKYWSDEFFARYTPKVVCVELELPY